MKGRIVCFGLLLCVLWFGLDAMVEKPDMDKDTQADEKAPLMCVIGAYLPAGETGQQTKEKTDNKAFDSKPVLCAENVHTAVFLPVSDANGVPLSGATYLLSFYQAFHLEDRAG